MARMLGYVILALTVVFALAPAYRGDVEFPIRIHHLLHAVILVGAGVSALLLTRRSPARLATRAAWLVVSIVAPVIAMLLMWPSNYSPLDKLPAAHTFEHLGLAVFGFLTAYAGQQYAYGVGTAMTLSLWAMAFLAAWGFGVSPPLQVENVAAASAANAAPASTNATATADVAHGKMVFAQNCASCHGARGEGGMGPSLEHESTRKNASQAIAWIENPAPPMPKLYPSTLSAADVRDVAAYIETLK
ncbi:MAG TPA: cytochrome c [Candidatus Baltobacteraceae bacterium]|jgi:mono/diheme cytochrome c family protein|nr:cytochrome c [Candidatus Baltobacteraceae bacterium]